jgi:hypothetical protein
MNITLLWVMAFSQACLLIALILMLKLKKSLGEFRLENEELKDIKHQFEYMHREFELTVKKLNKAE